MKGDFLSNPFDIEEKSGSKVDYSFAINGVIGISGIDWFFQPGSGEGMFPNKPPIEAGDTCAAVNKGMGVNGFQGM